MSTCTEVAAMFHSRTHQAERFFSSYAYDRDKFYEDVVAGGDTPCDDNYPTNTQLWDDYVARELERCREAIRNNQLEELEGFHGLVGIWNEARTFFQVVGTRCPKRGLVLDEQYKDTI